MVVYSFQFSLNHYSVEYFGLRSFIELLLDIQDKKDTEKMSIIKQHLPKGFNKDLWMLNEVFDIVFENNFSKEVLPEEMQQEKKDKTIYRMISVLCKSVLKEDRVCLVIDDAQNLDNKSWQFLYAILENSDSCAVILFEPLDHEMYSSVKNVILFIV